MTPRRATSERSDFSRTDWRRAGIGRIAVASGAANERELAAVHEFLTELHTDGQLDVLRLIKRGPRRGGLSIAEARMRRRQGRLRQADLKSVLLLSRNLWDELLGPADPATGVRTGGAIETLGRSAGTRTRYRGIVEKLRRLGGLPESATVRDLADVSWATLRERWTSTRGAGETAVTRRSSAADWNHLRRTLSSALSKLLGTSSEFRGEVLKGFGKMEKEHERDISITREEFDELASRLSDIMRPIAMTLAITGMRRGEYLGLTRANLRPAVPMIEVIGKGSKPRQVRVDPELWPWINAAVPSPSKDLRGFARALKAAAAAIGHPELRVHDLRHLNAIAAMSAGASINAVRDHLGHEDIKTTARYLRQANQREAARALGAAWKPSLKLAGGTG